MKGTILFIFGGMAEMNEEPVNPKAEFVMAIFGPLSSLTIAAVFYGIYLASSGKCCIERSGFFFETY